MKKFSLIIATIGVLLCGCSDKAIDKEPSVEEKYTITWLNEDGTVLETDNNVSFGETPSFDHPIPAKANSGIFSYTFNGWVPSIEKVTCDTSYTAVFSRNLIGTNATFDLDGGTASIKNLSYQISEISKDNFFFDVKKTGYIFRGWSYNGRQLFDQFGNQFFTPIFEEEMKFVAIYGTDVCVKVNVNIEGCTVEGEGNYKPNSEVNLIAHPMYGYEFVGWYDNNILVTTNVFYKCVVSDQDLILDARFEMGSYRVSTICQSKNFGLISIKNSKGVFNSSASCRFNEIVTLSVTIIRTEFRFLGWFINDERVSSNSVFEFTMLGENICIVAKFDVPFFELTMESNMPEGGTISNLGMHPYGEEILISPTANPGYRVTSVCGKETTATTIIMPMSDYSVYVGFAPIEYRITYIGWPKEFEYLLKGSYKTSYYVYENVILPVKEPGMCPGYKLLGWKNSSGEIIKEIKAGTTGNQILEAVWEETNYTVSVINNDPTKGTVEGYGKFKYNEKFTIICHPINGYELGEISTNYCCNMDGKNAFFATMPDFDVTYDISWKPIDYKITYHYSDGTPYEQHMLINLPQKYNIESNFEIGKGYTPPGHNFIGWKLGNLEITKIEPGMTGDIDLYAVTEPCTYDITIVNNNPNAGTVIGPSGKYTFEKSKITYEARPNLGYLPFKYSVEYLHYPSSNVVDGKFFNIYYFDVDIFDDMIITIYWKAN